jgi:DNA helicase-2/ATP-dependent DNA helicase PcrA
MSVETRDVMPPLEGAASVSDPFAQLNDAQQAAAEHGIDPSPEAGAADRRALLVIAGAGSGKTLTLAARVAKLVLAGADPQRILLMTFTRRAAAEMERRVARMLHSALRLPASQRAPNLPWSGTFHSIGARLLRDYAGQLGLSESFTVMDRGDSEDLLNVVRQALGLAEGKQRFPNKNTCLSIYSRVINSQAPLDEVLNSTFPWCTHVAPQLKQLFRGYVDEKQKQQVLDYDDLLLHWSRMLTEPALAAHVASRFDHVLVDEYQDTNRLQAAILLALCPNGQGLTVVGDDAQSIYAFRAAEVRNILDFPQLFQPPARIITLERNYRSVQPILDASNAVIALAAERHSKNLWTDRSSSEKPRLVAVADDAAQANWVCEHILARREEGMALKEQAVLFRTAQHSAGLELELTRRRIPFVKFGGLKFLEAAHVKDLLAVLRWAENPRSRLAAYRVAKLLPGMGPASVGRLCDALQSTADPQQCMREFVAPQAGREGWGEFLQCWEGLRDACQWPADLDLAVQWYQPQLQRIFDDAPARMADLQQLQRLAGDHRSRERFLTEMVLDPPSASSDHSGPPHKDDDYLILSTIHAAKGQEWKSVSVLNVLDGCIPSDLATGSAAEIEEERRLLYVAMTRAKQHLSLLVPQRFYVHQQAPRGDRHVYASISRFLPAQVQALLQVDSLAAQSSGIAAAADLPDHKVDVLAAARALWS